MVLVYKEASTNDVEIAQPPTDEVVLDNEINRAPA